MLCDKVCVRFCPPISLMEWILHKHFIKTLIALVLDYYLHEVLLQTIDEAEFQGFAVN